MYLAFLMISALDLLDALTTTCSDDEKRDYVAWIYRCQHPNGGFRMWPGTDFGERATDANAKWDPANVPATYFALAALLVMGDDFRRVRRWQTLQWLRQMQREDGSFGETLVEGRIEGGRDPRFGYCAAGVRHILRGETLGTLTIDQHKVLDVDVDAFVRCVRAAEVGTQAAEYSSTSSPPLTHTKDIRRRNFRWASSRTTRRIYILLPRGFEAHRSA